MWSVVCSPSLIQFLFQQLGNIISIIKQHARSYMTEIFTVIRVSGDSTHTHTLHGMVFGLRRHKGR